VLWLRQPLLTFAVNRFSLLLSTAFHFCCQPLYTFVVNCFSLLLPTALICLSLDGLLRLVGGF
jgi:hypothetical protein